MTKRYILWSGGCDSTYLLHKLAIEDIDSVVNTLSITHTQVDKGQTKMEAQARNRITAELEKRGFYVRNQTVNLDFPIFHADGFTQAGLWLGIAVMAIPEDSTLYLSYVRGDDFLEGKHLFEETWKDYCSLLDKEIKLQFPLIHTTKQKVLQELEKAKLLKLCWWCEEPKKNDTACGHCFSCVRMQHTRLLKDPYYKND